MGAWRIVRVAGAVLLSVALACGGALAAASESAGWPLEGPAEELVGYGEQYRVGEDSFATHRGIDLAAEAGSVVAAVLGGTVSFAGRIPAGEGATTLAVTVRTGDVRITLSPLSELLVTAGDEVGQGRALGILAETGDRSHPDPHVHVSARVGDAYVDPATFLAPPPVPLDGAEPPAEALEPAPVPAPVEVAPTPAPSPAPAPAPTPVPVPIEVAPNPVTAPSVVPAEPVAETPGQAQPVSAPSPQMSPVSGPVATREVVPTASEPVVSRATSADGLLLGSAFVSVQAADGAHVPHASEPVLPAPVASVVRAVSLDEGRVANALVADRRSGLLTANDPISRGSLFGAAALLAGIALWPLWRSVPVPRLDAGSLRKDVAAVVAR